MAKFSKTVLLDPGRLEYSRALELQRELQKLRINGKIPDTFITVEHPPVITMGKDGGEENILASREWLEQQGFKIHCAERGGDVTYHGPGQLVGYIVLDLNNYRRDIHLLVHNLEEALIRSLARFGIEGSRKEGYPGVWAGQYKIASIGISVHRWVTMHGFALNVNPDLEHFKSITPCGLKGVEMTSMASCLGRPVRIDEVKDIVIEEMAAVFQWEISPPVDAVRELLTRLEIEARRVRPGWLAVSPPGPGVVENMTRALNRGKLNTVCKEACCPNAARCFQDGTATFMILGDTCTRGCRFCSVEKGTPAPPGAQEPASLAETAKELGLEHVVVTSVTRDDLPDGGAGQFARVINSIREVNPRATVEVLVPDFGGSEEALARVISAHPEVLGHNLETVPRLYAKARPGAGYRRSLDLLHKAKKMAPGITTKSGLMVGLGEEPEEVLAVLEDLRSTGCDYITIGQYLQPTPAQLAVESFIPPAMFQWYEEECLKRGFRRAACGPLIRSSYRARPPGR